MGNDEAPTTLTREQENLHLLAETETETETQDDDRSTTPVNRRLKEIEDILRYEFNNKQLLEEAFTHASYDNSDDDKKVAVVSYERLEYVGDSVLNLLITKDQYFAYPTQQPGVLTRLRAANVDTEKLARVAIKHGFHRFLRHKKPLLEDQIREFSESILAYPLHSNGLVDVPKALADIVESTIGAVFIDCNSSLDIVWKVFKDLLEPIISTETLKRHPVTELYEMCQKRNLKLRFVDRWKETTAVDVLINEQRVGSAEYPPKKEIAYNRAAKDALDNISRFLDV